MQPFGPPGHMPGIHIPGTLVPIGAVMQQQDAMATVAADKVARKRGRILLLIMR